LGTLGERRSGVILDDHPLWLQAVGRSLAEIGVEVVGATTDPDRALALLEAAQPDLFITDVPRGPDDELVTACMVRALERVPGLKVVVLSAREDRASIEHALRHGAIAYVKKSAHPDDLAVTVRQMFHRSFYVPLGAASPGAGTTDESPRGSNGTLTPRELDVLRLVAEGHSNVEVAKMLWITEQTVKFHLSNSYRKLGVTNRTEAAHWYLTRVPSPSQGSASG
jgi:DNA-binding NarL/FixJ family response regulator